MLYSQDFHTIDLEPYKYGGTNITGFRLFDPNDKEVIRTVEELNIFANESGNLQDNMATLPVNIIDPRDTEFKTDAKPSLSMGTLDSCSRQKILRR